MQQPRCKPALTFNCRKSFQHTDIYTTNTLAAPLIDHLLTRWFVIFSLKANSPKFKVSIHAHEVGHQQCNAQHVIFRPSVRWGTPRTFVVYRGHRLSVWSLKFLIWIIESLKIDLQKSILAAWTTANVCIYVQSYKIFMPTLSTLYTRPKLLTCSLSHLKGIRSKFMPRETK